jgi:hypothetical protein
VNTTKLISELDKQIARLRQARNLLAEEAGMPARKGRLARGKAAPRKRVLTAEARAKMAAAQKRRWAAYRKAQ